MSYDMEYYTGRLVDVEVFYTRFYEDRDEECQDTLTLTAGFSLSDLENALRNYLPDGAEFEIQNWTY
jgi:hypothetical protein